LGTWPKTTGIEKEKERQKSVSQNKFEILSSRVMRYRVEIRKQEVIEKEKCNVLDIGERNTTNGSVLILK